MAQQGERVGPKKSDEPLAIDRELSRALVGYAETVEMARASAELLKRMDDLIEKVNQGLPKGHMVMTRLESRIPYSMAPNGWKEEFPYAPRRGSIIYRPDEDGKYRPDGEIATIGSREVFLGDGILRTDEDGIVVINSELGVGITTSSEVEIVDIGDDNASSESRRIVRQFTNLMPMIDEVRGGASKAFDTGYF